MMIGYDLVCTFAHLQWVEDVSFCALEDRICHQVVRRFGSLRKTKLRNVGGSFAFRLGSLFWNNAELALSMLLDGFRLALVQRRKLVPCLSLGAQ